MWSTFDYIQLVLLSQLKHEWNVLSCDLIFFSGKFPLLSKWSGLFYTGKTRNLSKSLCCERILRLFTFLIAQNLFFSNIPIYVTQLMFKVNYRNTRKNCKISSKFAIKKPEWICPQIVDFEQVNVSCYVRSIYAFCSGDMKPCLEITPSRPNTGRREKINLNVYFHTSLWCLKRFYEGLKGLYQTFWCTTKKCENKRKLS